MKRSLLTLGIITVVFSTPAFAAIKPCEELKAEIEAKLKEKGVNAYTLEIIPTEQVKEQTIIGSCEGGAKKISYTRNLVIIPERHFNEAIPGETMTDDMKGASDGRQGRQER